MELIRRIATNDHKSTSENLLGKDNSVFCHYSNISLLTIKI